MHSLKLAYRFLWKDRAFAALAIIVLTIGIGGVATQFSIVNGMLLRLPAFPEAERLVSVSLFDTARNQSVGGAAIQDFLDWHSGQQSFEELAMYGARLSINVTYQDVPRRYGGVYVTHTFFRTLGLRPLLGRDFVPADDQPGAAKTLIISHQLWQSDFGGASDIVGQAVQINGRPGTIIGVMPRGFSFPFTEQVWTPMFAEFGPRPRNDPQAFGGAISAGCTAASPCPRPSPSSAGSRAPSRRIFRRRTGPSPRSRSCRSPRRSSCRRCGASSSSCLARSGSCC